MTAYIGFPDPHTGLGMHLQLGQETHQEAILNRFVVISGCSGGGKSTLLAELAHRGETVVEEPGRRIVRQELASGGTALPWVDPAAFAKRAIAMALADLASAAEQEGWVFFDRGAVDAAAALEFYTGMPIRETVAGRHCYHHRAFLAPPWPEIFTGDAERQHGFDAAVAEYDRLLHAYAALGYETVILPKTDVTARADFVRQTLKAHL